MCFLCFFSNVLRTFRHEVVKSANAWIMFVGIKHSHQVGIYETFKKPQGLISGLGILIEVEIIAH